MGGHKMEGIKQLKKGFGELTLEDKMSFLTDIGANYSSEACFKCGSQIITKYSLKAYLRYANKSIKTFNVCPKCVSKIFNIEIHKIEFFGFLENFKKAEGLNSYNIWTKIETKKFIEFLKESRIRVDLDRSISEKYDGTKRETTCYTLPGLIKKYKLEKGWKD